MATRKPKIVPATEEVEETDAEKLARVKAQLAQMEQEFLTRLKAAASFDAGLVWVDCDLEGYADMGIRVQYNTENTYEVGILFAYERVIANLSIEDRSRLWSLFIRKVEWPFTNSSGPLPTPTPADLETYKPLFFQFRSLGKWMQGEGYRLAKEGRWGNASAPSEKIESGAEPKMNGSNE